MVAGCGSNCMKWCLIVFNVIFILLGICALALGIWSKVDGDSLEVISEVGSSLNDAPILISASSIVLLVGGAVILLIAILGCCGAIKQWKWMLCLYAFCLLVILIVELAAAILAIVYRQSLKEKLKGELLLKMKENYGKEDDGFTLALNKFQIDQRCCGIDSYKDYEDTDNEWRENVTDTDMNKQAVPIYCCHPKDVNEDDIKNFVPNEKTACIYNLIEEEANIQKGCYKALIDAVISKSAVLIGIGIAIVIVEIFGFIFACCLMAAIRREKVV